MDSLVGGEHGNHAGALPKFGCPAICGLCCFSNCFLIVGALENERRAR
jgi:hypothetical protein